MGNRRVGMACVAAWAVVAGCGDDGDPGEVSCAQFGAANCVEVAAGDSAGLLDAVNSLSDDTTVLLGAGTYELTNQVTIRANRINLVGRGMDETTLAFSGATAQINGVDVVGDDFLVQDLTVLDAPKDGVRVENSDGVTYRRVKVTWSVPAQSTNGAYGIYPVRSENVLIEDCVCENASDAGLYVGQSRHVIVRNNVVRGNVAGLEIENTQYADVYDNLATGNTGGIVVFDLPGNPVVGRDVRLRDNRIVDNNLDNFAPGGVVGAIPAGTGTFALASRRVEITDNEYANNRTVDIALLNGQIIDPADAWELETSALVGDWEDLGLEAGATEGTVTNFRTENIVIGGNTHSGSGGSPDARSPNELGQQLALLLFSLYNPDGVPSVIYDSIGESSVDADVPANNSNDNRICVGGNTGGTGFGNMNLENQPGAPHIRLDTAPFAPFDCTTLEGGPIEAVVLR